MVDTTKTQQMVKTTHGEHNEDNQTWYMVEITQTSKLVQIQKTINNKTHEQHGTTGKNGEDETWWRYVQNKKHKTKT